MINQYKLRKKINKRKKTNEFLLRKKYSTNYLKLKKKTITWKYNGVIFILSIMVLIIFIPTIIVMLPKSNSTTYNQEEQEDTASTSVINQIELPQITVSVKRSKTGEIEKVPLETYVSSVVASEMPADFEVEALKAQAIAARTYIVNHLLHQANEEVIISDTTEHQVYKNEDELKTIWGTDYSWKMDKVSKAVLATNNMIITYNQKPITPTFFSMSNGYTEDAKNYWGNDIPYLKSVESKWEEGLPNFLEQKIFTMNEISTRLGVPLQSDSTIPIKIKRTPSNRVSELIINNQAMTGREVREKLDLRSNDFTIQQKNEHLIFTTKGYGHGVGMSQYGANGMAKEGKTYEEILAYYYQDIEIAAITEAAPTLVAK